MNAFLEDAAKGKCEFVIKPLDEVRKEAGGIEAAQNAQGLLCHEAAGHQELE